MEAKSRRFEDVTVSLTVRPGLGEEVEIDRDRFRDRDRDRDLDHERRCRLRERDRERERECFRLVAFKRPSASLRCGGDRDRVDDADRGRVFRACSRSRARSRSRSRSI